MLYDSCDSNKPKHASAFSGSSVLVTAVAKPGATYNEDTISQIWISTSNALCSALQFRDHAYRVPRYSIPAPFFSNQSKGEKTQRETNTARNKYILDTENN